MSVRTTESHVVSILGEHYNTSSKIDLQPFIDTATVLVDRIESADVSSEMSDAALELVERYLAAHFYAHSDPIAQSRSTGRASGQFQGRTDLGFNATLYGQTAMRLDATGLLISLDQPQRSRGRIFWLGKQTDDQLDVDERS